MSVTTKMKQRKQKISIQNRLEATPLRDKNLICISVTDINVKRTYRREKNKTQDLVFYRNDERTSGGIKSTVGFSCFVLLRCTANKANVDDV